MNWIGLVVLLVGIFVGRILITKDNLNKVCKIDEQYNDWVVDTTNTRPSNAVFTDLYKAYSGNTTFGVPHYRGNRAVIITEQVDVIASFPSTDRQIMSQQLPLIGTMRDFFKERYAENFSVIFWIKQVIYLPQSAFRYLGIKENSIANKLGNFIWWIIITIGLIYKPLLAKLISSFL